MSIIIEESSEPNSEFNLYEKLRYFSFDLDEALNTKSFDEEISDRNLVSYEPKQIIGNSVFNEIIRHILNYNKMKGDINIHLIGSYNLISKSLELFNKLNILSKINLDWIATCNNPYIETSKIINPILFYDTNAKYDKFISMPHEYSVSSIESLEWLYARENKSNITYVTLENMENIRDSYISIIIALASAQIHSVVKIMYPKSKLSFGIVCFFSSLFKESYMLISRLENLETPYLYLYGKNPIKIPDSEYLYKLYDENSMGSILSWCYKNTGNGVMKSIKSYSITRNQEFDDW